MENFFPNTSTYTHTHQHLTRTHSQTMMMIMMSLSMRSAKPKENKYKRTKFQQIKSDKILEIRANKIQSYITGKEEIIYLFLLSHFAFLRCREMLKQN